MIRAATSAAIGPTTRSATPTSPVMSAATPTVEPTASTTTAVEAAPATPTTVTTATMLPERGWRANQCHASDCAKQNLKECGPVHGCNLHPTTIQEVRAA
jgi:hypothetical protein